MPRTYQRTERVGQLIQTALAKLLQTDLKDLTDSFVTITGVDVTKDFSLAKVYVSTLGDDEQSINEVLHILNQERKHLRYELAHTVQLRRMPDLRFCYDKSIRGGSHISSLLQDVPDEEDPS